MCIIRNGVFSPVRLCLYKRSVEKGLRLDFLDGNTVKTETQVENRKSPRVSFE